MLSRINRLKKKKEFNYIYKKGDVIFSRNFTIHVVKTYRKYAQVGISISKQVGNSVVRSRVKRIISEACRLLIDNLEVRNYVITAKPSIADKSSTDIGRELIYVLKKHGLFRCENV